MLLHFDHDGLQGFQHIVSPAIGQLRTKSNFLYSFHRNSGACAAAVSVETECFPDGAYFAPQKSFGDSKSSDADKSTTTIVIHSDFNLPPDSHECNAPEDD